MQDLRTHGIATDGPPAQTYCGLSTFGKRATHDPFKVDCSDCVPVMTRSGVLPDPNKAVKKKRGRPSKQERSMFGI